MLKHIEESCFHKGILSIKADTHKDNRAMQKALYKNGFQYCGIIYLEDNSERIAFEKILEVSR
jgi:RimJ/RimL family protein N-acetyltransferase